MAGAAALKIGAPGLPKTPPFIAAAEGPSKIQPPSDATVQSSADTGGVADEGFGDVGAGQGRHHRRAAGRSARADADVPTPVAVASARRTRSPVAPAADTPIVAPAAPSATVAPLFPDAKPVKTVSVRPDGTLISVDSTPRLAARAAGAERADARSTIRRCETAAVPAAAAGEAATPKLDLPTKLSPKSSARVVAKTDTTAPAAATDTTPNAPLQLGSPAGVRAKAAKTPPAKAAPVVASADAAAAPAAPAASGTGRGRRRLGGAARRAALRGRRAERDFATEEQVCRRDSATRTSCVRQADVKGETIYRVRAGGLSKDDAAALCAKLKASGGDCFIAKELTVRHSAEASK